MSTTNCTPSIMAADEAVKEFRAHQGGQLAGWERVMSRSTFTIDPRRPSPDHRDEERALLKETAIERIAACLSAGLLSAHDARESWGWGYLVDAAVAARG